MRGCGRREGSQGQTWPPVCKKSTLKRLEEKRKKIHVKERVSQNEGKPGEEFSEKIIRRKKRKRALRKVTIEKNVGKETYANVKGKTLQKKKGCKKGRREKGEN